ITKTILQGSVGIGDTTPASLFTVGNNDLFQVNSSGAIASAAGITSSGAITFSGLSTAGIVTNTSGGVLGTTATVPVANGGTNIASYTIGDLIYASGATTLSKLADVAAGSALLSGGVGVAPSWGTIGASGITADSLNFTEFNDTLDLDANTTINGDDNVSQLGLSMVSDLSVAARTTSLFSLTQANNVTNDFDGSSGLIQLTNNDTASDAALFYLDQNSTTSGAEAIFIDSTAAANTYGINFGNSVGSGTGINFNTLSNAGVGISVFPGSLTSGTAISMTGSAGIASVSTFSGDYILINPTRTLNTVAGTLTDTGNVLDLSPSYAVNLSGRTYNITGDLIKVSSTLTETLGTITDTRSLLSLTQNCGTNADCIGAVLSVTSAGAGNGADISLTNTSGIQSN